mgnify:CR=1 FL=1
MEFDGISCIVSDTAGMRISSSKSKDRDRDRDRDSAAVVTATTTKDDIFCSADAIEYEGMRRARDVYLASHVKILICDASDTASVANTLSLLDTLQTMQWQVPESGTGFNDANISDPNNLLPFLHKPVAKDGMSDPVAQTFVIFNKTDLLHDRTYADMTIKSLTQDKRVPLSAINFLSCSTGTGLPELEASLSSVIKNLIRGDDKTCGNEGRLGEGELITRTRHRHHVVQCVRHLETFLGEDLLMDTAAEELRYYPRIQNMHFCVSPSSL